MAKLDSKPGLNGGAGVKMISAGLSKAGGRAPNEDALGGLGQDAAPGCWVVADGQGKRGGGDVAAQKAVRAVLEGFAGRPGVSDKALGHALRAAQQAVAELQAEIVRNQSLRVAVAVLCADGRHALWAHLGDARVYAFRDGALLAQTQDHSVPQTLANAGEIAPAQIRKHADGHRLLRALGAPGASQPTFAGRPQALRPGDAFLLCSQGFWRHVTELQMLADWCKSSSLDKWLEYMEMRLLEAAPAGHDNYSAIALLAEAGA